MKDKKMAIWDQVKTTDPKYTKKSTFGRSFTSISPQYQLQEATKVFGPYGKGFGFESCDIDLLPVGDDSFLAVIKAVFFFVDDDGRHSFPINNTWDAMKGSKKKNNLMLDDDFAKKAETNTLSKALSKLGFSADIFMGLFDDHEYVSIVSNEKAIENAEDKISEEEEQKAEYRDKCLKELELLSKAASQNDLQKLFTEYVRRANLHKDKDHILALTQIKDKMKGELS